MELHAQAKVNTSNPPPPYRDAKSPKLPAFVDEKYELISYLLRFERYAKNAKMGESYVGHQVECITVRKSHGCIHQDVQ